VGDHNIGPYFFEENLNSANYLHFLTYLTCWPVGNQVLRIM